MNAALVQMGEIIAGRGGRMLGWPGATGIVMERHTRDSDAALPNDVLRTAGLRRPGSMTEANRLAASLVHWALDAGPPAGASALLTCSASSVFAISLAFERDGLASDWRLLDPFHLPNSIPTALPTSVARLAPGFALALAMGGTGVQVDRALEYALALLHRGRVDECWVIAAEQASELQTEAATRLGMARAFHDAASFVRLVRCTPGMAGRWCISAAPRDPTGSSPDDAFGPRDMPNGTQCLISAMLDSIDADLPLDIGVAVPRGHMALRMFRTPTP
jgi:hypothetical protein